MRRYVGFIVIALAIQFQTATTCHTWFTRPEPLGEDDKNNNARAKASSSSSQQHAPSFFFLCERLGKNKVIEKSFGELFKMYSDNGGCYAPGSASDYSGWKSRTHSGLQCERWDVITKILQRQIFLFQKEKSKEEAAKIHNFGTKSNERSDFDMFIELTNKTIGEMMRKDILHHNYCRDPDDTGIPWCYVKSEGVIAWEPCDVPKCTTCWRIRHKAETDYGRSQGYWSPFCHMTGGHFLPLQCYKQHCWCSARNGTIHSGSVHDTRLHGMPVCEKDAKTTSLKNTISRASSASDAGLFMDELVKVQMGSYEKLIEVTNQITDIIMEAEQLELQIKQKVKEQDEGKPVEVADTLEKPTEAQKTSKSVLK